MKNINFIVSLKSKFVKLLLTYFYNTSRKGKNYSYKKFLVTSYQRSGSTMLTSALNNHSKIVCFSELYNPSRPMFNVETVPDNSEFLFKVRRNYPDNFVLNLIFRGYDSNIKSVGFKIFPNHVTNQEFSSYVNDLIDEPEVKIIHLVRKNKLAIVVSLLKAKQTGAWAKNEEKNISKLSMYIPTDVCLEEFIKIKNEEEFFYEKLKNKNHLTVFYEDILLSPEKTYSKILSFLNHKYEKLQPITQRQRTKKLSQYIENYSQLKDFFIGTEWDNNFNE